MTLHQSRPYNIFQHPTQHHQPAFYEHARQTAPFDTERLSALDLDLDVDLSSLSSSPTSTQSLPSRYSGIGSSPLSTFDSIPTPTTAAPRVAYDGPLFPFETQSVHSFPDPTASLFAHTDLMQTDAWLQNGQLTPRSVGRFSHNRESSRSSLGSNGPMSPYSHNISNPQIAVGESVGENFHGISGADDLNYHIAAKSFPGVSHDSFYTTMPSYGPAENGAITTYPSFAAAPKRRTERGLLPHSDHPIGSARSQPVSVASSIASNSPATPAGDPEEDRRHNIGEVDSGLFDLLSETPDLPCMDEAAMHPAPKLDRTMTDVYSDELYSPNFTITSATPGQVPMSPSNNLFTQRLQAANNQHLAASGQSPASAVSRDQSPFRQGSPLAPGPMHEFPSAMGSSQVRFGSAQQIREQNKAMQDAQALRHQIARSADTSTPQTISPKDAMLEFHEPEGDANCPLFPQQNTNEFDANAITKAAASQNQTAFDGLHMDSNFNFLASQLPAGLPVPQRYPFVPQQQQQGAVPSAGSTSLATSRVSSADTAATESAHGATPQRPASTNADGGTYTCTYHGCTLRFDTPALLQKHKREGHRQAHGLSGPRRTEGAGMTSGLLNTQAGPHRCDRINPSTGKPCATVFSRPYDLTRHEDTIHNARKQKVRCDLCTDEKTFSRADALTRHYRVCHPDVEFPSKHRKRVSHS
ncbi:hypothetical protein MFIFM68171_03326 [Madurella fahalii]|uniref:C2H2-type domain-containing protein n=1 Tax=Madurella fahalii TaxID=1157608 RepID=A0ABQ0G5R7_9PEZI